MGYERKADKRVSDVGFGANTLTVVLMKGRTLSVPLAWFARLLDAAGPARAMATGRRRLSAKEFDEVPPPHLSCTSLGQRQRG